ncbi:hypothetical protein SAMN04487947_0451 [Halogeometricum rufum]|uniref:Matrixin n=1 Tax=Halogeometricum rufum TaxID=553469 RepID=A0A1I6G2D4_9EURY|nr:hypothetical protein [Halogeometricum rufum]SFR36346.1 hypothetical protein SAMN04487947_0451 [Halogeometricum rufum]
MRKYQVLVCFLVLFAGCSGEAVPPSTSVESATQPITPESQTNSPTENTPTPVKTVSTETPTSESLTPEPPSNPFASNTVRVGYRIGDDARNRSFKQPVVDALAFWNNRSAGSYRVNYTYEPDPSEAQILIQFVDTISYCDGYDDSTVGCAPVLDKFDTAEDPTTVRVEDDYAASTTRDIIIHELGHTRGLEHSNSYTIPQMNATIDTLLIPKPNLENRSYGWNTTTFRVYFDTAGTVSSVEEDGYRQEIREGWEYWTTDTDHLNKDVSFEFVDSRSESNIVVKIEDTEGVRWQFWALNTDSDDSPEVYENSTLYVGERNPKYIDYNTALALGYLLLNADNETDMPEPFDGDEEFGDTDRWTD